MYTVSSKGLPATRAKEEELGLMLRGAEGRKSGPAALAGLRPSWRDV